MPGGGLPGQHRDRLQAARRNMTRTLAEADGVCKYQPPPRVPPGPGRKKPRKKRGMKRSMTWRDPSLLVNRGDKTSKKIQTETQLSAGGYRCNLCG